MSDWTAAEVKDRLRGRHPATQAMGVRTVPGPWTCIEELLGCDFLAIAATRCPKNGPGPLGVSYPRVGYEVKVSRADYRKELRAPHKRANAVALTHAFYFAVPTDILTGAEMTQREPVGDAERTLWVPEDVGLVVVGRRGSRVLVDAPIRREPQAVDGELFGVCARHISSHPDPRHDGVVARDRALCLDLRGRTREFKVKQAEDRERWAQRILADADQGTTA